MQIELHVGFGKRKKTHRVEITFPHYHKHILKTHSTFSRWDTPHRLVAVTLYRDPAGVSRRADIRITEAEIARYGDTLDYQLGRGDFALTGEKFNEALQRAEYLIAEAKAIKPCCNHSESNLNFTERCPNCGYMCSEVYV